MQLTMSYVNELTNAVAKSEPPRPVKVDMAKNQVRKQGRTHPKSTPPDADELRQRLYVVIAEREARNDRRNQERVNSLHAKEGQIRRENSVKELRVENRANATTAQILSHTILPPARNASTTRHRSKPSLQDKLRQKSSKSVTCSKGDKNGGNGAWDEKHGYVPSQAATQFARTTTSENMRTESHIHSLSRSALDYYLQGSSKADREALDSTFTPAKQRGLLKLVQHRKEHLHERNRFQDPDFKGNILDNGLRRSKSLGRRGPGPGGLNPAIEAALLEDEPELPVHRESIGPHSEEERYVDPVTANEYRVDWTQRDQMLPHEKKGSNLLRKTSSIWTLRSKLRHSRTNSDEKARQDENKYGFMTIREHFDEGAEIDDGSTPVSPNSSSSLTARLGLFRRLKI
ncbi:hypothetical protein GGR57DRAFT_266343 [Xylariaceae sp. FL1272]|nr:hypothetical protein GGR57DRAFT_266343 [Xylariaceae sp. FL1272]